MTRPSSCEVVAHEDVFAANGMKLIAKGAQVTPEQRRFIHVHPITSCVVLHWLMADIANETERRTTALDVQSRSAVEELVVLLRAA